MPFVPRGLKSQENPLKHRFNYRFALSATTATQNSAWITLVRHDKLVTSAVVRAIKVNPHNTERDLETGPVCAKMSIIDNLKLQLTFAKSTTNNIESPFKVSWTPFFASFESKYDAADDDTGVSVSSIMQLTKDSTNEDVVPLSTNKLPVQGLSEKPQPLSSVNLTEVATTHYNMTTDAIMEDTPFDKEAFIKLISWGTNKGALKACLGKTRTFTLNSHNMTKSFFIKKFVPRPIRRIVPFGFFGILIHVPIESDANSYFNAVTLTVSKCHIGVEALVTYDEWNEEHNNQMQD